MRRWSMVVLIAAVVWTGGVHADEPLRVMATIPPLAYLVEAVGGEHVAVETLLQPGDNPHVFEPTPRQAAAIARAGLFVGSSEPFEAQITQRLKAVHPGFRAVSIAPEDAHDHGHAHHDHAHSSGDPHVWLAGDAVQDAARTVAAALIEADPANRAAYEANLEVFIEKAHAVHKQVQEQLAPYAGRAFLVYHAAFGHFAAAYGLRQLAVEHEGNDPAPRQLRRTIAEAREQNIRVIFVQPQFSRSAVEAVRRAIDGTTATLNPLERDVLANLQAIADAIEESFVE